VAIVTGVSYARLTVRYPSRGGTITFVNRAFGTSLVPGAINLLLWLGYLIMLALYARAFSSYLASLTGHAHSGLLKHLLATGVILVLAAVNTAEAKFVGRLESTLVYPQFTIVAAIGLFGLLSFAHPLTGHDVPPMLYAGGLTFLAFEGFELIANAAGDARRPERDLSRAFTISILAISALYVLIALVAVGRLGSDGISSSRDFAVAEVGRSVFGRVGFLLMGITAVVDAASAINSTFYGTRRLTLEIAKDGELPDTVRKRVGGKRIVGLLLTAGVAVVLVNVAGLESISLMGSAVFLIVFGAVHVSAWRLRHDLTGRPWVPWLGVALCAGALAAAVSYAMRQSPAQILVLVALLAVAAAVEAVVQRRNDDQEIDLRPDPPSIQPEAEQAASAPADAPR
jgi:amino acid transporter